MRTYSGASYEEARAHITRYRAMREILIESYVKMGTTDNWNTIDINWSSCYGKKLDLNGPSGWAGSYYNPWLIRYYPDGTVSLGVGPGKIYPSVITAWNKWTPITAERIKAHDGRNRLAGLRTGNWSESRNWKCRKCRGYQWQGADTEKLLAELMIDAQSLEKLKSPNSWWAWQAEHALTSEQRRHVRPCEQCLGTGRYDYGTKAELFEIHENMLVNQDGSVVCDDCKAAWEEATERSSI